MPLRKHQSVKQTIQATGGATKLYMSQYGVPYDGKMFDLVDCWSDIFLAYPDVGRCDPGYMKDWSGKYWLTMKRTKYEIPAPMNALSQTAFLLAKLREAIETKNGDFFRKLADTIERFGGSPVDRLRHWLCERFLGELYPPEPAAKGFENIEIPREEISLRQLFEEMKRDGIPGDEHQLRRACRQLGLQLAKGKRGRPKGKRSKSRDSK